MATVPASVVISQILDISETSATVEIVTQTGGSPMQMQDILYGMFPKSPTLPYAYYGEDEGNAVIASTSYGTHRVTLYNLKPSTTYFVSARVVENQAATNNIHYSGEVSFKTLNVIFNPPTEEVIDTRTESQNRRLIFKVECLDNKEKIVEEKSLNLVDGKVDVGSGGYRRKASFTILEPLPELWQSYRWKLYYGYVSSLTEEKVYFPLGVFIPINPTQVENAGKTNVEYQAVDKVKLFKDYKIPNPVTFTAPIEVREVIKTVAGWLGETKLNLESFLGTIAVNRTFEEGTTAETILNTIVSSFSAEWFYDVEGYLVGRKNVDPLDRDISFTMDDIESPIYISSSRETDDSNYYNQVTVVGGTVDTPIYRISIRDYEAVRLAGGRIVSQVFKIDGAVTQAMVDGRAAFYLSGGVQLPVTLNLESLVIPNLEIGDIITKENIKYEVRSFNIPLGVGSQSIKAGQARETNRRLQQLIFQADNAGIAAANSELAYFKVQRDNWQITYDQRKAISDNNRVKEDTDSTNEAKRMLDMYIGMITDQESKIAQLIEIRDSK